MLYKEWDSAVLGVPTYELESLQEAPLAKDYTYCKTQYDLKAIQYLEKYGFKLCDVSLEYFLDIRNVERWNPDGVRFHTNLDVDRILEITRNSFYMDRFHKDPNLTKEQADNLYKEWVINACNGNYGDAVFVAEFDSNVIGYSVCRVDGNTGNIDLTATDVNYLSPTVSPYLIFKDIGFFKDYGLNFVKTSTQLENIPSRSSLERFGFKEIGVVVTMSKGRNG